MINGEVFIDRYFSWLMEEAFPNNTERGMYVGVCLLLFDIPFYWQSEHVKDENRAGDASCYRHYERHMVDQEQHNISSDWLDQWENATPSVLEVMVGIAERWSTFFDTRPTPYYFSRHLFRNMGFSQFRGRTLRKSETDAVRWLVDNWLSRQIGFDGTGSPFPITKIDHFTQHMREVDIWDQMNAYSYEHFQ